MVGGSNRVVCLTRPLPGGFEVGDVPGGVEVRVGPGRGFGSVGELHGFVRGAAGVVTWFTDRVDGAFLDAAGDQLEVVCNFAVGYDNIDVPACRERGVVVCNTPDAVTDGTADVAVGLLIAAARRMREGDEHARSGAWEREGPLGPTDFIGRPIAGGTLLIVGAGRIGHATASRMVGWGMRVLYVSRGRKAEFELPPLNGEWVGLEEGLAEADFVSVHTPLTEETRGLIGARELGLMKRTAVLVNTSRGPVVDEAALADALESGGIFAAGLDVFEREPAVLGRLKGMWNVVMTPHFGSASERSRGEMARLAGENVGAVLRGEEAGARVG